MSLGIVDVAQVDQRGWRIASLIRREVEAAELVPLGDDDQRVGALAAS